jgi:hypothetical protein
MKTSKFFIALLSASLTLFTACKKDEVATDPTEVSASEKLNGGDYSMSENLFSEAYQIVEMEAQKEPTLNGFTGTTGTPLVVRGACPAVTITPTGNTFPKTLTLDYGTGCTTKLGKSVSGKITAVFTGKIKQTGGSVTVTFQNFKYKGYTLGGTYKATFTATMGSTAQITNGTIATPDGKNLTYSSSFTIVQTEGVSTTFITNGEAGILDDVYAISGSGSGTDQTAKTYTVAITTPLIKKLNCEWINTGVVEIKITGAATKKLDFGAGTCDNQATLMVGRLSTSVTLP